MNSSSNNNAYTCPRHITYRTACPITVRLEVRILTRSTIPTTNTLLFLDRITAIILLGHMVHLFPPLTIERHLDRRL
jgi:hypothetical protein